MKKLTLFIAMLAIAMMFAGCDTESGTTLTGPEFTDADKAVIAGSEVPESEDKGMQGPSTPPVAPMIHCQGTKCTLPGEQVIPGFHDRKFNYIVTPGPDGVSIVQIGIHTLVSFVPTNMIMPPNWHWGIDVYPSPDRSELVRHGELTTPNATCTRVLKFYGPTMTEQFQLAYDNSMPANTVSWQIDDSVSVKWNRSVGMGQGPVHSPTWVVNGGGGTYIGPGDTVPIGSGDVVPLPPEGLR